MKLDKKIIEILRKEKLTEEELNVKLNLKYENLDDYLQNMVLKGKVRREGNPWIYSLNIRGI